MQAPPTTQRTIQRRSPAADQGPSPNVPARVMSPGPGPQARSSTSAASVGGRRQNGSQSSQSNQNAPPLSQIEKSVTHLLVATKQLLETLTSWSRGQATDAQVSDVYVRLGYEFNIACRAFTAINVDTSDLGNVPELLRHILESTLSQEASVESLENYLPRIRDIIINLLHGLKRKQSKLRQRQAREGGSQNGELPVPRNSSVSSVGSGNTGITTLLDQGISDDYQRDEGGDDKRNTGVGDVEIPPRMPSASSRRGIPVRDQSRASVASDQSSLSSGTMQNIPVLIPYPGDDQPSVPPNSNTEFDVDSFPPPPPPPKQTNALAALQRGGELERRASRRYSAYQISKHLGASPNGVPMLPPAQNSPIPNRGRNDTRESMRAVQNRGDQRHMRQQSSQRLQVDASPARIPGRISEELSEIPELPVPTNGEAKDGPIVKTRGDSLGYSFLDIEGPSATLQGPVSNYLLMQESPVSPVNDKDIAELPKTPPRDESGDSYIQQSPPSKQVRQFTPEPSPPPGKELTLFLQYKTKVKKFVLAGGYSDLSVARLQLAFIEKFAWNTHNNGVDLPEIYIQDSVSGVRHELEDLNDIKDRSVLVLNIEVLDEVKRHIDEGLGGIKKIVEGVKTALDDQQITIQRVSDRQQDTAKEIARISSPASSRDVYVEPRTNSALISPSKVNSETQQRELQGLRRDLAVIRQTYSSFQSDIQNNMTLIRKTAATIKTVAAKTALPDMEGDSGRIYVNTGKKILDDDSDKLVAQVDDLQDMVEDLRKDVVLRGVRPRPSQLENVAKDISGAAMDLKKMQDYMKRERPIWTKIWEKELERVCKDREDMTAIEELMVDLEDDLDKASQTFSLVEEATKEQMKDTTPRPSVGRAISRGLNHVVAAADPAIAKEGVLGEVRALQPNHENRLEAIERAEKLRQKELESRRGGEFQKELGSFVEEGKLRKSGGFEEVERARKAKDDKIRREVWERQNGMTQADAAADEPNFDEFAAGESEVDNDIEAAPADI